MLTSLGYPPHFVEGYQYAEECEKKRYKDRLPQLLSDKETCYCEHKYGQGKSEEFESLSYAHILLSTVSKRPRIKSFWKLYLSLFSPFLVSILVTTFSYLFGLELFTSKLLVALFALALGLSTLFIGTIVLFYKLKE